MIKHPPLPTLAQIESATVPLSVSHQTAVGISYYMLSRKEPPAGFDTLRRSMMDEVRTAMRALGYDLMPRAAPDEQKPFTSPRLVVDNSEESA